MSKDTLPGDSAERKALPVATGVLDYFPAAIAEIAKVSKFGNDKHNPGEELHWTRGRSNDHADALLRHFMDRGGFDPDGIRHSAQMAWRALALLQVELEEAGAPLSRGSVPAPVEVKDPAVFEVGDRVRYATNVLGSSVGDPGMEGYVMASHAGGLDVEFDDGRALWFLPDELEHV